MHQVDLTTGQEDGRSATACSFGFAMSDLAALEQFNTREKPGMMGVAQAYLIGPCAPLDNTFNTGWNLADYLTEYTGGTKFVALASGGTETNERARGLRPDDRPGRRRLAVDFPVRRYQLHWH